MADGAPDPQFLLSPHDDNLLSWAVNTRHYRNKQFEDAVDYYTMALHYCPEDEEHKKDRAVYLANRAQGHLQLKEVRVIGLGLNTCRTFRTCTGTLLLSGNRHGNHVEELPRRRLGGSVGSTRAQD